MKINQENKSVIYQAWDTISQKYLSFGDGYNYVSKFTHKDELEDQLIQYYGPYENSGLELIEIHTIEMSEKRIA